MLSQSLVAAGTEQRRHVEAVVGYIVIFGMLPEGEMDRCACYLASRWSSLRCVTIGKCSRIAVSQSQAQARQSISLPLT